MRVAIIYAAAFCVGAVVMGFEMLGSRYLFPYFGGGIGAWAALISVVLLALMAGYYLGGYASDRIPKQRGLYAPLFAAGAYFLLLPSFADALLTSIMEAYNASAFASLSGAVIICFLPLTALGMVTPWCVKLIVRQMDRVGSVTGLLYAISTLGNVFGVLFTTYVLIPSMGSRDLTRLFGLASILIGLVFLWLERRRYDA